MLQNARRNTQREHIGLFVNKARREKRRGKYQGIFNNILFEDYCSVNEYYYSLFFLLIVESSLNKHSVV